MLAPLRRARLAAVGIWMLALHGLGEGLFLLGWLPLRLGRFFLWLADRVDAAADAVKAYAASLASDPVSPDRAGGAP